MDAFNGRSQTTKGILLARCMDMDPGTIIMDLEGSNGREQGEVANQRFFHSIAPGRLAGDRRGAILASEFSFTAQHIWKVIKENKDLNLPAHKVMVATIRCEEIVNEKIASFADNEEWRHLEEAVQNGVVSGFGKKLSSILENCLISYDMEAEYFDDSVRTPKRRQLESKLLQFVQPAYHSMLGHLRSKILEDFKARFEKALESGAGFAAAANDCTQSLMSAFNEGCKDIEQVAWDSSKEREKLRRDIDTHVTSIRQAKLSELTSLYEEKLNKALSKPVEALLDAASDDTWPAIRRLLQRETKIALSGFASTLSSFDIAQTIVEKLLAKLEEYARSIVEYKAREEAVRVLMHMKDRFSTLFSHDSDSMPRLWTGNEDIKAITKMAHSASLKLLSVIAAIRLDGDKDNVENSLQVALVDVPNSSTSNRSIQSLDPLASSTWEDVPSTRTLITPVQCKSLWRQFKAETGYIVTLAVAAQEANKRNNNWLPPPWAIAAMLILGFNEFMTHPRNFLYLGVIFVAFLLGKASWVQLDISGKFQNEALSEILSWSKKFLPTAIKKLADEEQRPTTPDAQRNPKLDSENFRNDVNSTSTSAASSNVTSSDSGAEYTSPQKQRSEYEKRRSNIAACVSPSFRLKEGDHAIIGQCRYEKRRSNIAARVSTYFGLKEGDHAIIGQCSPLAKTVRFNVM